MARASSFFRLQTSLSISVDRHCTRGGWGWDHSAVALSLFNLTHHLTFAN